jgi:hypothetical protein
MTETLRGWWPRSTFRCLVAGLAVGLAVLLVGASSVVLHPKSYSSGATLVFLDATSVQELSLELGERVSDSGQSPFARDYIRVMGDIFARTYRGAEKRDELAAEGFVGQLTVSTTSVDLKEEHGPVFAIGVQAPSPAQAVEGAELVVADVAAELRELQQGYDPRLSINVAVASPPSSAIPLSGSRVRVAVAYGVLAILAALSVSWGLGRWQPGPRRAARLGGSLVNATS